MVNRRRILVILLVGILTLSGITTALAHTGHRDEAFLPDHMADAPIIEHIGFTLRYSEAHEQALWVAYELTADETDGRIRRTDDFRPDPAIVTGSAALSDYRRSGYDRGHLAPAGDMKWSKEAMSQSFFLSNMSPQIPAFNRGIWRSLEAQIRIWARQNQALYIVTGPVLTRPPLKMIGTSRVTVPAAYFKVIVDPIGPDVKAIGFLMPNARTDRSLRAFAVSIDEIEQATGLDFFTGFDDKLESALESTIDLAAWLYPEAAPVDIERRSPIGKSLRPWFHRWVGIALLIAVILWRVLRHNAL